jgi:ribonuclease HI|tara:strand:- start:2975 stop:3403 length:429 start_codon:yes stop_codon:yes gene_type:complete
MKKLKIYTDGACKGNPGPGGWGALIIDGAEEREVFGGENSTTNNRMELLAAIRALSSLDESCDIEIYTDSKYLQDGITKWLASWQKRGWLTANKKPVKNKDLWEDLSTLVVKHKIKWNWVKGHSGDFLNERADFLANKGINA